MPKKKAAAKAEMPVPAKRLDYEIILNTPGGPIAVLPRQSITLRDLDNFEFPAGTNDPAEYQARRLLEAAEGRVAALDVPSFIARQPTGIVRFPGFTDLHREVR